MQLNITDLGGKSLIKSTSRSTIVVQWLYLAPGDSWSDLPGWRTSPFIRTSGNNFDLASFVSWPMPIQRPQITLQESVRGATANHDLDGVEAAAQDQGAVAALSDSVTIAFGLRAAPLFLWMEGTPLAEPQN